MVTATKSNHRMPKKVAANSRQDKAAGTVVQQTGKTLLADNASLRNTVAQIEKQFGEGAIMPLGTEQRAPVAGISTGSLSLDLALGGVGIPKGRVVEIYGPESSGKTTIALHVIAQAQKAGGIAAFID